MKSIQERATLKLFNDLSETKEMSDLSQTILHFLASAFVVSDPQRENMIEMISKNFLWELIKGLQYKQYLAASNIETIQGFNCISYTPVKAFDGRGLEKVPEEVIAELDPPIVEDTKFELRYFWPDDMCPEIINAPFLTHFKSKETVDQYVVATSHSILKKRRGSLSLKKYYDSHNDIPRFRSKENENEFIIEVKKNRNLYKLGQSTKLELSKISVQGELWKTLCIESPKYIDIVMLNLLVNTEGAEKLSYPDFLGRYR